MDDAAQGDAGAGDSGSIDAGAEPRILEVADVPSIMCADSLGGREAEFSALRAADVGLAGGDVELARTPSSLIVAGPPIEAAFGTPQLVLREDVVPDQPVGTLLGAVPVQGPSGPAGTQLNLAAMFVDTLMSPPSGEAGFQFETPNTDGACFLSFSIRLRDP